MSPSGRGREAVGHGQDRDLVDGGARDQRQGDAGRPRVDHDRVLALHGLIAFDAFLGVVAGLAFLEHELHAADAAVALVEHAQVVVHAVGDGRAGPGEGAGAVGEEGNIDRVLREGRKGTCPRASSRAANPRPNLRNDMFAFPPVASGRRRILVSCLVSLRPAVSRGTARPRSFCLPICQSRARPCGSTIRKKMMSAPTIMKRRCSMTSAADRDAEGLEAWRAARCRARSAG